MENTEKKTHLKAHREAKILLGIVWVMALILILNVNFVMAWDWDNVLNIKNATSKYPTLEIKNALGLGSTLAKINILENTDDCIINCYAIGTIEINQDEVLFTKDNFDFFSGVNVERDLKKNLYIERPVLKSKEVPLGKTTCSTTLNKNGSQEELCSYGPPGSKTEYYYLNEWIPYAGSVETAGVYKWKLEGTKKPYEAIDWAFSYIGIKSKDVREYWAWWNATYTFKRLISITSQNVTVVNNISLLINVTYNDNMHSTFKDIRFANAAESALLPHELAKKYDGISALFWVHLPDNTNQNIFMYYNATGVNDGSDFNNAFIYGDNFAINSTLSWQGNGDVDKLVWGGGQMNITYSSGQAIALPVIADQKINDSYIVELNFSNPSAVGCGATGYVTNYVVNNVGYSSNIAMNENPDTFYIDINAQTHEQFIGVGENLPYGAYVINISIHDNYIAGTFINRTNFLTLTDGALVPNYLGGLYGVYVYLAGGDCSMNWFRVRPYSHPPPTYSIGNELANTVLDIDLVKPADNLLTKNSQVLFNCSAKGSEPVLNLTLVLDQVNNITVFNSSAVQNISLESTINLSEGWHNWTCKGTDLSLNAWAAANRSLRIDLTFPEVNITEPIDGSTIISNDDPAPIDVNATVSDDVSLSACWYGNVTGNFSIACGSNVTLNFGSGWNNISWYANDTVNNIVSSRVEFFVNIVNWTIEYRTPIVEGDTHTVYLNISANNITTLTANVTYNNTAYPMTVFFNLTNGIGSRDFTAPFVTADRTVNLSSQFILNGGSDQTKNQTQQIFNIAVDNCTAGTFKLFNFSMVEELNETVLTNTTIDIAIDFYNNDRSVLVQNFSQQSTANAYQICLNRGIPNGSSFRLDAIVGYTALNHEKEYYNIVNLIVDNDTHQDNITLYDLANGESTEFQLTFTGSNFLAVEDALIFVKRQYIEQNVFKVVELPKTDSNGQTVLHLVRNDVIYNIVVMKNGEILGTFNNIIAFCDDATTGDCKINLDASTTGEAAFNYNTELGLIFIGPTFNNASGVVTFNFVTTDGTSKNVSMVVERNDVLGNRTLCSTSVTSSGGTLTCLANPSSSDSILIVIIDLDGVEAIRQTLNIRSDNYGVLGYLLFFVYMLAFILMFNKSKNIMLIGIMLGFIVAISLGLINSRIVGFGAAGIWLIVIIILMLWKLNKNKPN